MGVRSQRPLPASPFAPGPGGDPPVLAGRESEQERLREILKRLAEKRPPATNALLIGPRGNGKTALLGWMENRAKEQGMDALCITPSVAATLEEMALWIRTKPGRRATPQKELEKLRVGIQAPGETGGDLELGWRRRLSGARQQLRGLMARRAARKPFLLLLDEAHTLDPKVGAALLNEAQNVARERPFLLVLAGTPGLRFALTNMHATFWARSAKVGVGLVSAQAARLAIEQPLSAHRISLKASALWDEVTADSQGYPYFVQFWGDRLWQRAEKHRPGEEGIILSREDIDAAAVEVCSEKLHFYNDRYAELLTANLVPAAQAVAEAYASGAAPFYQESLEARLQPVVGEATASTALSELEKFGYVWCPPGSDRYTAGIPNLMQYTTARAAETGVPAEPHGSPEALAPQP